jgi:hypothetical protein
MGNAPDTSGGNVGWTCARDGDVSVGGAVVGSDTGSPSCERMIFLQT